MTPHDRLLAGTAAERADLLSIPIVRAALAGEVSLDAYQAFLQEAYHHVRHTVPLLMSCGGRLPARLEWLRAAIGEYIEEEMGHQEWVLDDLGATGADRGSAAASEPSMATELMVAYAYDTIARKNPIGFFGMVLVLEGTSVALATHAAHAIERSLDLPRSAFSYLLSHGDLDVAHVGFYQDLINRVDVEDDFIAIQHAAKRFYILYGNIFRDIASRHMKTGTPT